MTPLKQQAIDTALTGDWQNAVALNRQLVEEDPQDLEALNRLAFAFTILGKIKEAKDTYQKVLQLDSLNPIALRNLKRLAGTTKNSGDTTTIQLSNMFLEETGKTRIIELINVAQPDVIAGLRTGQSITMAIKRSKIFIQTEGKQYVGMFPDDMSRRLIKFVTAGNKYEVLIKSADRAKVVVFIKELKRAPRFKLQPSLLLPNDKKELQFEKNHNPKLQNHDSGAEEDYSEDEASE